MHLALEIIARLNEKYLQRQPSQKLAHVPHLLGFVPFLVGHYGKKILVQFKTLNLFYAFSDCSQLKKLNQKSALLEGLKIPYFAPVLYKNSD
jgi:hypothetical protein